MSDPIVEIYLGQIKGKLVKHLYGDDYYSFQGIPYAKPPIGDLRFKPPQSPEKWTGILDATKEGNECYQRDLLTKQIIGSEDCLYLNVYTKRLPDVQKQFLKPVIVYLNGSTFTTGSKRDVQKKTQMLITEDTVLVTINYRLGMLGFLSLEDPNLGVTGNAGLKDQVMALKWIKKCINAFGGDPSNVTIFGGGAGGVFVHLLMLTKMAKGLFKKVIAENGCALNPWSLGKRCTDEIMDKLNLNTTNERVMLECLIDASMETILRIQEEIIAESNRQVFGPIVERRCENVEPFLLESPLDIILSGNYNKVPLMIGYTDDDERMIFELIRNGNGSCFDTVNFESLLPHFLNLEPGSEESLGAATKLKTFYFNNQEPSAVTLNNYYTMLSDINYIRGIYSTVKNHVRTSTVPIYFYNISSGTSINLLKTLSKIAEDDCKRDDDFVYTIKGNDKLHVNIRDITFKRLTRFWINFVKYGDPNPLTKDPLINVKWRQAKRTEMNYLIIENDLKMSVNPMEDRMRFWDGLFQINAAITGM